ncbi:hypothetical protein [Actinomadura sp. 21ATH]|uniref:hypothetical protein n=1 Tax=Actinomadura sp. 21ATH TaxID=1735444 RepID=UPI0035BF7373
MTARIGAYGTWLADSHDIPKLLLTFDSSPTLLSTPEVAAWCKDNIAGPADRALRPSRPPRDGRPA